MKEFDICNSNDGNVIARYIAPSGSDAERIYMLNSKKEGENVNEADFFASERCIQQPIKPYYLQLVKDAVAELSNEQLADLRFASYWQACDASSYTDAYDDFHRYWPDNVPGIFDDFDSDMCEAAAAYIDLEGMPWKKMNPETDDYDSVNYYDLCAIFDLTDELPDGYLDHTAI